MLECRENPLNRSMQENWIPTSEWGRPSWHPQNSLQKNEPDKVRQWGILSCCLSTNTWTNVITNTWTSTWTNVIRGINLRKIAEQMGGSSGAEVKGTCTEAGQSWDWTEKSVYFLRTDIWDLNNMNISILWLWLMHNSCRHVCAPWAASARDPGGLWDGGGEDHAEGHREEHEHQEALQVEEQTEPEIFPPSLTWKLFSVLKTITVGDSELSLQSIEQKMSWNIFLYAIDPSSHGCGWFWYQSCRRHRRWRPWCQWRLLPPGSTSRTARGTPCLRSRASSRQRWVEKKTPSKISSETIKRWQKLGQPSVLWSGRMELFLEQIQEGEHLRNRKNSYKRQNCL